MRNVIVTGGSRGLGLAISRKLASGGYRAIAIARRDSDERRSAHQEADTQQMGSVEFRCFDLSDVFKIRNFIQSIRNEYGPIYGLVNNAAVGTSGILSRIPDPLIEQTVRLNVLSPIILTKEVVRAIMAEGSAGGRIVSITSIVSATGFSGLTVYGATKAAIVGFTRSLARELGPLNITVNAIAPGFFESEMTLSLGKDQQARIVRRSALKRLINADDIAGVTEFLMGNAAANITGTVVTVDAGSIA